MTTTSIRLAGACNRCGLCCFMGNLRCANLIVTGTPGQAEATRCAIHGSRHDGMPIVMFTPEGRIGKDAACAKDSQKETDAILERGIGKGCSLCVVGDHAQDLDHHPEP